MNCLPRKLWFAILSAVVTSVSAAADAAKPSAVVLMYHRFGEPAYPSTNINLDLLDAQIAYLKNNRFNVAPLPQVVAALKSGTPLPEKTVAITVDDAYASVISNAWPRFQAAEFPFTVFVATEPVDRNERGIMSWQDLRALVADGVTIGAHSHAHPHLPALSAAEAEADLAAMTQRFEAELGHVPELYAYPYGEAGDADVETVKNAGFIAAFGQNSGPVYGDAGLFYLPRFALNDNFGRMSRFTLVVNTLPLRAVNLRPASAVLTENPPRLSFDVVDPPAGLAGVSCYGPDGLALPTTVADASVDIAPLAPFPPGRARVNCTLRSGDVWYWFGHEMVAGGLSEGVPVHPRYGVSPAP